jgi:hypothetical protein
MSIFKYLSHPSPNMNLRYAYTLFESPPRAQEVVGELGCHVVRRNIRSKVQNESIQRHELKMIIYRLTSAPDPGTTKCGDGV